MERVGVRQRASESPALPASPLNLGMYVSLAIRDGEGRGEATGRRVARAPSEAHNLGMHAHVSLQFLPEPLSRRCTIVET